MNVDVIDAALSKLKDLRKSLTDHHIGIDRISRYQHIVLELEYGLEEPFQDHLIDECMMFKKGKKYGEDSCFILRDDLLVVIDECIKAAEHIKANKVSIKGFSEKKFKKSVPWSDFKENES